MKSTKKFFIGYTNEVCQKLNKKLLIIKKATSKNELNKILEFCEKTYGETTFIEKNKWYSVRKMENLMVNYKNSLVGFASYKKEKSGLFLLMVLTNPKYFRLGIGTILMKKIKKIAEERKAKK